MTRERDHTDAAGNRRLRRFFAAVHADDRAPSFERLAHPKRSARPAAWRPAVWRPAMAVLVILTLAAGAVYWMAPLRAPNSPDAQTAHAASLSDADQLALARELSSFRTPLDFLLETPGREIFDRAPSFELMELPPLATSEETQP